MNLFDTHFPGKKHVFLPVIHSSDQVQTLRNAKRAKEAGADGVFVINHGGFVGDLATLAARVADKTGLWVGLNWLGRDPLGVLGEIQDIPQIRGIWSDWSGVTPENIHPDADEFLVRRAEVSWKGIYMGGVAFKTNAHVGFDFLTPLAEKASEYMDVLCTSGPGTARAADPERIVALHSGSAIPLAIASGMTPENLPLFKDHARCFLVASGVQTSWTELSLDRMESFVSKMNE